MKYILFLCWTPFPSACRYGRCLLFTAVSGTRVWAIRILTIFTNWCDITFIERWWYAGSTRGVEIAITDLLALVLFFSAFLTMHRKGARLFWPASLWLMLVYLGYGCLSVALSDPKLFGFFELTKLMRGLVIFLAISWYVRTNRDARILAIALSAALICEGGIRRVAEVRVVGISCARYIHARKHARRFLHPLRPCCACGSAVR